jgi:hypothetical protein
LLLFRDESSPSHSSRHRAQRVGKIYPSVVITSAPFDIGFYFNNKTIHGESKEHPNFMYKECKNKNALFIKYIYGLKINIAIGNIYFNI